MFFKWKTNCESLEESINDEKLQNLNLKLEWMCLEKNELFSFQEWKWNIFAKSTGVNFTNILRAACMHADPISAKKTVKSSTFRICLCRIKPCVNTLMKSTPAGVNFTNTLARSANAPMLTILRNQFYQQNFPIFTSSHVTPNFHTVCSAQFASEFSINRLTQKLLIKWLWNWPLLL